MVSFCPFVLCALCSDVLPRCSQATLQLPLRPLELQLAAAPRIGCTRSAAGQVAERSSDERRLAERVLCTVCRGAQGCCKQVAEERCAEESAKVVPSCSSVVCADAAAASRVVVIVSLVLLQAIAAESCSCCSALTSACVR